MNAQTRRFTVAGPAGALECALDAPGDESPTRGLALVCHPHPQHGGTMDNKVVMTVSRALVQSGYASLRFNFRGVGASEGAWDDGRGEIEDALAVLNAQLSAGQSHASKSLVLAGFSFGGYVASQVLARCGQDRPVLKTLLVAPAVVNFTVAAVPAGTLVVHGELDDVVPLQAALDWARPQQQPIVVLPTAGHFFHGQLPVLKRIVLDAFS
jgi:uncharacterized protein